jgi:hypothetical protein
MSSPLWSSRSRSMWLICTSACKCLASAISTDEGKPELRNAQKRAAVALAVLNTLAHSGSARESDVRLYMAVSIADCRGEPGYESEYGLPLTGEPSAPLPLPCEPSSSMAALAVASAACFLNKSKSSVVTCTLRPMEKKNQSVIGNTRLASTSGWRLTARHLVQFLALDLLQFE